LGPFCCEEGKKEGVISPLAVRGKEGSQSLSLNGPWTERGKKRFFQQLSGRGGERREREIKESHSIALFGSEKEGGKKKKGESNHPISPHRS